MNVRKLGEILQTETHDRSIQVDWDRQLQTADAINERFGKGFRTVLLADEVGMGKTYVALAAMAQHVFQTDANDRRVMLVVPPNSILRTKWEQEIRSFNKNYLRSFADVQAGGGQRKQLRPLLISDYWDLVGNLHDYGNQPQSYVTESSLRCFAYVVRKWADRTRRPSARYRQWEEADGLDEIAPEYLDFCSRISPQAVEEFLDECNGSNDRLRRLLDKSSNRAGEIKRLLKEFGSHQDLFEPNVFVLGMGALRRQSRRDNERTQLFNTYITARALSGCWPATVKAALGFLSETALLPHVPHERWAKYFERLMSYKDVDLWGMKSAVDRALATNNRREELRGLLRVANDASAAIKCLRAIGVDAVALKMTEAGIGLAVVDEVHNWKNGGNGAERFQNQFAPFIERKLIMSATPFQIHEGELKRVFEYASGGKRSSEMDKADRSMAAVSDLLREGGAAASCLAASWDFLQAWKRLVPEEARRLADALPAGGVAETLAAILQDELARDVAAGGLADFAQAALRYRKSIVELRASLFEFIVRHTKQRDKRHFHAGCEFRTTGREPVDALHERRTLYSVPGYGDSASAMANFLAMRLDQMVRTDLDGPGQEVNAHVLLGLTSSNAAFRASNEHLKNSGALSDDTRAYLGLFDRVMRHRVHPKVEATVSRAFENWRRGLKTLIFCERCATLDEIGELLNQRILEALLRGGDAGSLVPEPDDATTARRGEEFVVWSRKTLMKEHLLVDLYWARSLLVASLPSESVIEIPRLIKDDLPTLAASVRDIQQQLGTRLSPRSMAKLADLVLLRHLRDLVADEKLADTAPRMANLLDGIGTRDFAGDASALKVYLRIKSGEVADFIESDDDADEDAGMDSVEAVLLAVLGHQCGGSSATSNIWHDPGDESGFHVQLWKLMGQEFARLGDDSAELLMLQVPQGFQKVLLRPDLVPRLRRHEGGVAAALRKMTIASDTSLGANRSTPWQRVGEYLAALLEAEGSLNRKAVQSSKRQSLWKGVFLTESWLVAELRGGVHDDTRVNRCAAFNSPLAPDILVCTAIGSEGIDLHRYCADVIHHDLPWNPAKLEQRIGRIDRVGSLAERQDLQIYVGIPFLAHAYEKFQYEVLHARAQKFEVLMGRLEFPSDVPDEEEFDDEGSTRKVLDAESAAAGGQVPAGDTDVPPLPEVLLDFLKMDLSIAAPGGLCTNQTGLSDNFLRDLDGFCGDHSR